MLPEQIDDRNIYLQHGNGIIIVTSHYDTMAARYSLHIKTDASWYWQLEETEKKATEDYSAGGQKIIFVFVLTARRKEKGEQQKTRRSTST